MHIKISVHVFPFVLGIGRFKYCKFLHSRKSFVLGELSFAGIPLRQYCLSVNKIHCYTWSPELVKCSQWQPCGVVTQHGLTQILGHPKLLQNLNPPQIYMSKLHIFKNSKFGATHVGSPHNMAVTVCNKLILVNKCKTEFHLFSYNYNSNAFWQNKVHPEQGILGWINANLYLFL